MNQTQLLLLFTFGAVISLLSKKIVHVAVYRRVTFSMILVGVLLVSLLALRRLPIELMPNIAYGNVTIFIDVRGGMPSTDVERLITKPIEESMGTVSHLKNIISSSKQGRCVVTLEFDAGTNMNIASLEVRERFLQINSTLPKDIEKPVIARYEEADAPVYIMAFTSKTKTPEELRQLVEEKLKDKLMRVEGVANVEVSGGRERKIIVDLDEHKLAALNLSMQEVVGSVEQNNLTMLVGQVEGKHVAYGLRTMGAFSSVDEIAQLGIRINPQHGIVRLSDVGTVKDSYIEAETFSRLNAKEAVTVYVQKETTANTIRVTRDIKRVLENFDTHLDPHIKRVVISDQADTIVQSIASIEMAMFFGMLLIIVVLGAGLAERVFTRVLSILGITLYFAVFIACYFCGVNMQVMTWFGIIGLSVFSVLAVLYRDYRPPFLIAITMPIALLITAAFMSIGNVSINVMSLSGLILGIGLFIDNSIVVVENFLEHRKEHPDEDYGAVIQNATHEMVEPIVGSTLTTVVVFLAFSFLEKKMQLLYADLAFTVTASLFASLFCAFGVVPMYLTFYEKPSYNRFLVGIERVTERGVLWCATLCRAVFAWIALQYRTNHWKIRSITVCALFVGICAVLFILVQKHVYPLDKLIFICAVCAVVVIGILAFMHYDRSLAATFQHKWIVIGVSLVLCTASLYEFLQRMPKDFVSSAEERQFTVFVELASGVKLSIANNVAKQAEKIIADTPELKGILSSMSTKTEGWSTKIYVTLVSRAQRPYTTQQVIDFLRPRLEHVGAEYDGFVYFSEPQEGKELFLDLYGYDYKELSTLAMQVASQLSHVKGLTDVKIRYRPGRPQISVEIDQQRAAQMHMQVQDIAETMHAKMRGLRATEFRSKGEEVETVARLIPEQRETITEMKQLYLVGELHNQAVLFPLEHVASLAFDLTPSEIWHRNKTRMIQVSANIGSMALEEAATQAMHTIKPIKFPKGYYADIGGDYDELVASQKGFKRAIVVTAFLTFAVMACSFESLLQPLILMFTLVLSLFGAVAALIMSHAVISSGVLIGFLMLGGFVVNNGILLVCSINSRREEHPHEDIFVLIRAATKKRIKPVFMTAATALCDLIPLMFDTSDSSVLWSPFAIAVTGGMITSTILTLFVIPMLYTFVAKKKQVALEADVAHDVV